MVAVVESLPPVVDLLRMRCAIAAAERRPVELDPWSVLERLNRLDRLEEAVRLHKVDQCPGCLGAKHG